MKTIGQTFIAIIRDKDGKQLDFQRYPYKRLSTVKNHLRELAANSLYKACVPGIDHADIYETPYEWQGLDPVYTINL